MYGWSSTIARPPVGWGGQKSGVSQRFSRAKSREEEGSYCTTYYYRSYSPV